MRTDATGDDSDLDELTEPLGRLTRDLKEAARTLTAREARFLVDCYYQMQGYRLRMQNVVRTQRADGEPHEVIHWFWGNAQMLEAQVKRALDTYSLTAPVGQWARSIKGIGPVIAAGLLAHIDLEPWKCTRVGLAGVTKSCRAEEPHGPDCHRVRVQTAGQIWRFAGLDPTSHWEKGQKRPWNAALKRLMWLLGESFTKVSGRGGDVYGHLYLERKHLEETRNADGRFADQATQSLTEKRWRPGTSTREAYEAGRLPQARIHLRAQRWAVKLFLSDYHAVAYVCRFGVLPPRPYILTVKGGHAHEHLTPNMPEKMRALRIAAGLPVA